MAAEESGLTTLRVMTLNVWFAEHVEFTARASAVFDTIRATRPDVVCLQEVLPPFVDLILQSDLLNNDDDDGSSDDAYILSGDRDSVRPYGVCMLARASLRPLFEFHELPTHMARKLLTARLTLRGGSVDVPIAVGTVHLESLNNHKVRERQMKIARRVLEGMGRDSLLVGDFNFCSYRNYDQRGGNILENDSLARMMPKHVDLWPLLRPGEPGYTFDSEVNLMIQQHEQMRYDRIVAKLGHEWTPTDIVIVASERISLPDPGPPHEEAAAAAAPSTPPPRGGGGTKKPPPLRAEDSSLDGLWPSDHFGLLATLTHRAADNPDHRGGIFSCCLAK